MINVFIAAGICGLAFWMGYSVNQGGTCAVATAHQIVHHRQPRLFIGLIAASAAAALVSTGLVWSGTVGAMHAGTTGVTVTLVLGAAIFGCGALVNDGCLLGSLSRLGDGDFRFVLLPIGLAAGFLLASPRLGEVAAFGPSLFDLPGPAAIIGLATWGIVLVVSLMIISNRRAHRSSDVRQRAEGHARWPLPLAVVVLGVSGGTLFATAPAWTYAELVRDSLPLAMAMADPDAIAVLAVGATVCGSIVSSVRRKAWKPRRVTAVGAAKTVAGGLLMGVGVAAIPGGNDGLVLAAIPALSPGGIAAYLTMTTTIILGLWLIRLSVRRGPQPHA